MKKTGFAYLVSACLCGRACRYNGSAAPHSEGLWRLYRAGRAVLVCPECLGGLKIPRLPAEIRAGRVFDSAGQDLTPAFKLGAARTLAIARKYGISKAILKERSPSCGSSLIYDGSFSGRKVTGQGITAALLRAHGLLVCSEEDLPADFSPFEPLPLQNSFCNQTR